MNKCQTNNNPFECSNKTYFIDNTIGQWLILLSEIFSFSKKNIFRSDHKLGWLARLKTHIVLQIQADVLCPETSVINIPRQDISCSQKRSNILGFRMHIHLKRRCDLLDSSLMQNSDPVGEFQSFLLIVCNKDRRNVYRF